MDMEQSVEDGHAPPISERLDLTRALERLRPEERAALALCLGEGLSHAQAALVLDAPLGTVKSWTQRGRARLQELLSDYAPGPGSEPPA
jgi:RNA polymerase sigma-70 factor (ECF subfamily)